VILPANTHPINAKLSHEGRKELKREMVLGFANTSTADQYS
jgi:hypothetical protein